MGAAHPLPVLYAATYPWLHKSGGLAGAGSGAAVGRRRPGVSPGPDPAERAGAVLRAFRTPTQARTQGRGCSPVHGAPRPLLGHVLTQSSPRGAMSKDQKGLSDALRATLAARRDPGRIRARPPPFWALQRAPGGPGPGGRLRGAGARSLRPCPFPAPVVAGLPRRRGAGAGRALFENLPCGSFSRPERGARRGLSRVGSDFSAGAIRGSPLEPPSREKKLRAFPSPGGGGDYRGGVRVWGRGGPSRGGDPMIAPSGPTKNGRSGKWRYDAGKWESAPRSPVQWVDGSVGGDRRYGAGRRRCRGRRRPTKNGRSVTGQKWPLGRIGGMAPESGDRWAWAARTERPLVAGRVPGAPPGGGCGGGHHGCGGVRGGPRRPVAGPGPHPHQPNTHAATCIICNERG